jgi:GNAT superfamily N-acetyltransferase
MIKFASESGIKTYDRETYNYEYARNLLLRCEKTGVCLVAEDQGKITGTILSMRVQDIWVPDVIRLRELAWWVQPEYRSTTVGARLFSEYRRQAQAMLDNKKITGYTITKLSTSPDFDYERRGFKFVEATYMIGD